MQSESAPPFLPALSQRFSALVWSCLDSDLNRSAVFYAERFFVMEKHNHDARHLYATALLSTGQTYSAMHLVNQPEPRCSGCLEIKAKCCTRLGRHRQAREALEQTLQDTNYLSSASRGIRSAKLFPDEAALRCRAGTTALKGNLPDTAFASFRQALALNPMLWEAFEGLCALGSIPEIEELFPPRPSPVRRAPPDEPPKTSGPTATGAGFFTPDTGNSGNLFCEGKFNLQPFRMGPPTVPRDLNATAESPYYPPENSFYQSRSQAGLPQPPQPVSRPLSSADEGGPVAKRLRSTTRPHDGPPRTSKPTSKADEQPLVKKARPATKFAKLFSSSRRRSQPASTSRTAVGKNHIPIVNLNVPPRRSTRLLSRTANEPSHSKRDRRRQAGASRSRSIESDGDDDPHSGVPPSPPSAAHSPRSDVSVAPSNWTVGHEQAAQDAYDSDFADHYLYDLTRRFASATRALAMYDCRKCLDELEQLPAVHQRSPWVLAMVGRAHYERLEYASAERAFKTVRMLEPYRLWDMEVYSTLLWHLQRNVQLSFLAQELLNINPQSAQAWIAVGNLFSLQKDRSQALTCFRRAVQMDSSCAYAYTLSGHESIDDDLEKAINFFQSALRADPRHYNAWYGLGTCYLRLSKIRLAEYHFRKAVQIHPNNAVLLGCVGMAVERRGDREAALALFDEAIQLAPENALVRYRRAKILIALKKYQLAIEDLEALRDTSPEESNVVFQLAKAYRLVGDEVKFTKLLAIARDISPKSIDKIKKLLETVKEDDEEGGGGSGGGNNHTHGDVRMDEG